ncbi:mitochondrial ribosomal small subunit component, partial [Massospora cicadina]
MTFRKLPSRVFQTAKSLVQVKLIDEPRWLKAAEKHPNTDNFLRCSQPIAYDCPLSFEGRKRKTTTTFALSSCTPISGKATMCKTRFRPPKPPRITYPEDKLRLRFFKDHPFEMARPVSLIEKDGHPESNWDKVLSADKSFRVSNEEYEPVFL